MVWLVSFARCTHKKTNEQTIHSHLCSFVMHWESDSAWISFELLRTNIHKRKWEEEGEGEKDQVYEQNGSSVPIHVVNHHHHVTFLLRRFFYFVSIVLGIILCFFLELDTSNVTIFWRTFNEYTKTSSFSFFFFVWIIEEGEEKIKGLAPISWFYVLKLKDILFILTAKQQIETKEFFLLIFVISFNQFLKIYLKFDLICGFEFEELIPSKNEWFTLEALNFNFFL